MFLDEKKIESAGSKNVCAVRTKTKRCWVFEKETDFVVVVVDLCLLKNDYGAFSHESLRLVQRCGLLGEESGELRFSFVSPRFYELKLLKCWRSDS